ncbi:MAG: hypothetical protein ACFE0Q_01790 [Anaerolineae bacterium]
MVRLINLILLGVLFFSIIVMFVFLLRRALNRSSQEKAKKAKRAQLPDADGLRELIMAEQIDEAVDLYQRFTGVDIFTAREAVQDMSREIRLGTFESDVVYILKAQGKAAAIEAYQAGTGSDLAEALEYVETLEKR